MKYEYNKVQNKFLENGHTMFEQDVLQRLQRLAYLESKESELEGALIIPEGWELGEASYGDEHAWQVYIESTSKAVKGEGNTRHKALRNAIEQIETNDK